jgi:hypothetical protein
MAGELLTGFPNIFRAIYDYVNPPAPKAAPKKAAPKATPKPTPAPTKKKLKPGNALDAASAGINAWLPFEVGNRIGAAAAPLFGYAPGSTYSQRLQAIRDQADVTQEAHPYAYAAGAIPSAIVGGGALTRGVSDVASKLPGVVGKVAQAVTKFEKGKKVANVGRLALGGAAYGATDEALNGGDLKDVGESALVSGVAAPLAVGTFKGAAFLGRPVVDMLSSKNFGQILRRFTKSTPEELQAARAEYVAKTGAEPTLFEILPKHDRDNIGRIVIGNSTETQDKAAGLIRQRAQNVEPEMRASVETAAGKSKQSIADAMAYDLAQTRGSAVPEAADMAAAREATGSTAGAAKLREQEARNIMAPHDPKVAYGSVDEMLPKQDYNPVTGEMAPDDPEASALIRRAAGLLPASKNGITISNITDIQRGLKRMVDRNDVNSEAAQRALQHIDDLLQSDHPEAAAAIQQMRDAYAGRSRMIEGMQEGGRGRTPDKFPVTDAGDLNTYRNIYETPEGEAGRTVGQVNQLAEGFAGTPEEAIAATGKLANSTEVQRAIAANVSPKAALQLTDAAEAQSESLKRLAALRDKTKGPIAEADIATMGDVLLAFNPGSFPLTRMAAVSRLVRLTKLGDAKAGELVDMLFSQDPAKIDKAIRMFDRVGGPGRKFIGEIAASIPVTAASAGPATIAATAPDAGVSEGQEAPPEPDYSQMSDEDLMKAIGTQDEPDYSQMSDEELLQQIGQSDSGASPYEGQADAYSPEFKQLFDRVLGRESSHQQMGPDGQPITSSAGAIGIAQVMPGTAPQAAELAGLPWDENAYYTDEHYNKALGAAYLNEMLKTFNGDPALATAAYNAGPKRVMQAVAKGQDKWFSYLPDETKQYLQAIFQ